MQSLPDKRVSFIAVVGKLFPLINVNIQALQIALANVFVTQSKSTDVAFANDRLTVQQRLWDALVAHPQNMNKTALAESGVHSGETSTSQHVFVSDFMLPPNSENRTEALLVEGVIFI